MAGEIVAIMLTSALAGCTVGPDYRPRATAIEPGWISPVSSGAVDLDWWSKLQDPLLNELVTSAIADNKDLAEASARLREARANRDAVRGRSSPQIGASGAVTQNRLSENGQLPVGKVPGLGRDIAIYDAGFDASWELDLWGGTRRAIESAEARSQLAEEARRAVILQVIAEVARSYVDLRTAQTLRANAITDAQAQAEIARLVAERLRVGLASRFDLVRAQEQAQSTAAAIPGLDGDAAAAAFRIALLLGKRPEDLYERLRRPGQMPPVAVAVGVGLKSELLLRRPDIRQAERDLAAATAEVGVATSELFPRIALLGGIGAQARGPGDLLSADSLRFQVGPALRWPIFSAGRIRAQIRAADARADAALIRYDRAVLNALADSETAINRYVAAGDTREQREGAQRAGAEAVSLAKQRYTAGEDDLIVLLQTQSKASAADRLAILANATELQQLISLYKALGGGWQAVELASSS